jgi:hypothetical protein
LSLIIPTRSDVFFYDLQVNLEDVTYTLQFRWNVRLGAWFMSIFDEQGTTPILVGLRLVADWPLGAYNTGRNPPGVFVAHDTSSQGIDPGVDDLGSRVQLVYFSSTELGL